MNFFVKIYLSFPPSYCRFTSLINICKLSLYLNQSRVPSIV